MQNILRKYLYLIYIAADGVNFVFINRPANYSQSSIYIYWLETKGGATNNGIYLLFM